MKDVSAGEELMPTHGSISDSTQLARAMLLELLDQVRRHTIEVLEAAQPSWLLWAPAGTSNHILWHAGHALWLQDVLGVQRLTGKSELPPAWDERFGMNCRPVKKTSDWPTRREVKDHLRAQWSQLKRYIEQLPDERLELTRHLWVSQFIHGLHDEARHQGEMYLLYKMCRAMNGSCPS